MGLFWYVMYFNLFLFFFFFFSSRRRHTRLTCDWSSECALPIYSVAFVREESAWDPMHFLREQRLRSGAALVGQRAVGAHARPGADDDSCGHAGQDHAGEAQGPRSEERRVGKAWRPRSGGSPEKV